MNIDKNISKGGLLGALLGTLASAQTFKPQESSARKIVKTGIWAGLGYAVGTLLEKTIRNRSGK